MKHIFVTSYSFLNYLTQTQFSFYMLQKQQTTNNKNNNSSFCSQQNTCKIKQKQTDKSSVCGNSNDYYRIFPYQQNIFIIE